MALHRDALLAAVDGLSLTRDPEHRRNLRRVRVSQVDRDSSGETYTEPLWRTCYWPRGECRCWPHTDSHPYWDDWSSPIWARLPPGYWASSRPVKCRPRPPSSRRCEVEGSRWHYTRESRCPLPSPPCSGPAQCAQWWGAPPPARTRTCAPSGRCWSDTCTTRGRSPGRCWGGGTTCSLLKRGMRLVQHSGPVPGLERDIRGFLVITLLWMVRMVWVSTLTQATWYKIAANIWLLETTNFVIIGYKNYRLPSDTVATVSSWHQRIKHGFSMLSPLSREGEKTICLTNLSRPSKQLHK